MQNEFNLIGEIFNRLRVLEFAGKNKSRSNLWKCICECGRYTVVASSCLRNGHTKSCGCINKELASKLRPIIHSNAIGKGDDIYRIWSKIKDRCLNPNSKRYPDYGGRGISMFEEWVYAPEGFIKFRNYMGQRPSKKHSIDRYPNNDGNYEPGNIRWATAAEQCRGRRSNVWIEYNGEKMIMKDWSNRLGVDNRLIHRMYKSGKPFSEIYEFYNNKKKAS